MFFLGALPKKSINVLRTVDSRPALARLGMACVVSLRRPGDLAHVDDSDFFIHLVTKRFNSILQLASDVHGYLRSKKP